MLDVLCPTLLVCLGVLQQVLHEVESLRQILVQSVEADLQGVVGSRYTIVASQVVESLVDVAHVHLLGTDIVEVIGGIAIAEVILIAKLIAEDEVEQAVLCVLLIDEWDVLGGLANGQVLLEVEELWLDRRCLGVLHLLEEVALILTVGWDRGDGRLLDFHESLVLAHALIDAYEVVVA